MSDLILLKAATEEGNLPVALNTAYCWHSRKRYPKLIVKLTGRLFWNRAEWRRMEKAAIKNQVKEAKK